MTNRGLVRLRFCWEHGSPEAGLTLPPSRVHISVIKTQRSGWNQSNDKSRESLHKLCTFYYGFIQKKDKTIWQFCDKLYI